MSKVLYLFKVSMEKSAIELIRYKFNTISDILSLYALFISMFLGIKIFGTSMNVSSLSLGNTLEGFVVGYFMWTIMMMAYSDTSYSIINDASRGTLEQLSMSNLGLHNILIVRSICNLLVNLLISIVLLFIIMYTTGYWIHIKIVSILIPIFIGIFSILGIGLIFGGLALIFKKIQSILNIVQYFLIALLLPLPASFNPIISSLIPFKPCSEMVFGTMINGASFTEFSLFDYRIMIGNSIVYFGIGLLIFNYCSKLAKRKGVLGQY